jgi:hypothetical protein
MPAPSRTRRDEIVAEMLLRINPPADQHEAVRDKLRRYVAVMPQKMPELQRTRARQRSETTERLKRYHQWLLTKRRQLAQHEPRSETYVAALDAEIEQVQRQRRERIGHRPRDQAAEVAVLLAAKLLEPERHTLTVGGDWHRLSMLFMEAATGEYNAERVKHYMELMLSHGVTFRHPLSLAFAVRAAR